MRPELPIDAHLPGLVKDLADNPCLVLTAPPGAGKTTRLPPALIDAPWMAGRMCLVLEPRRIAARAAARRVAAETGTKPGELAGYQVRHERVAGPASRILYCTEGIVTARLQGDPFLDGVGAVVLDEFHERSLDADLCLSFLKEIRAEARPDLRLVVCSATLDPGPVARFLGARTRVVPGSLHPVDIEYLDKPPDGPLEETVASGVRSLWPRRPGGRGDLLVFLPGAGEIQRARRALEPWASGRGVALVPLHGELPPEAQDSVLDPSAAGERVILSTNVAETSLTLPSVTAVVDAGLVKLLRHDPASGMDRLELAQAGRDSCDQRAGRAGRVGPGAALRLWTRHEHLGRPERLPPEAQRADLARAVLEIAAWGHPDPATFGWFEPPQSERLEAARELLRELGALGDSGLTPLGRGMLALPLHPRLAGMLLEAARRGFPRTGAALGALLAERDILRSARAFSGTSRRGLHDSDLLDRLELLEEAERAGFDPGRCRGFDVDASAARSVARDRDRLARLAGAKGGERAPEEELLRLLFHAFPDRVGRRREEGSRRFVLAGGGGAALSEESLVRRAPFVVALRIEAGRRGERSEAVIRWASAVEPAWLSDSPLTRVEEETFFDPERRKVCAVERTRYRDLVLSERPATPDPEEAAALLAREAARDPGAALRPDRDTARLLGRMAFLARTLPEEFPAWDGGRWEELLAALAHGRMSFEELRRENLGARILASLSPAERKTLAREAPDKISVPSGREVFLDYPAEGPPVLSVKMQEVFGWEAAPRVARGRSSVLLHLLGPHGRPLQVTSDLASFWKNGYPEVRKEMRGRYPRHDWPEDPSSASPSRGVRKR